MIHKNYLFLGLCLLFLLQLPLVGACLIFNQDTNRCQLCTSGMRLFKGNCIYNINHCIDYYQAFDCKRCQNGYKVIKNIDRIECTKLQILQTDQILQTQLNPSLQNTQNSNQRQQFYIFLNEYFAQKYQQSNLACQLVKVLDRMYHDGTHEAIMIYKISNGQLEKIISSILGNYETFQIKQIVPASPIDINDNEIVIFETDNFYQQSLQFTQKDQTIKQSTEGPKQSLQQASQNEDQIKETSDFNFEYQKPQLREKDIGFQTSNEFIRLSNNKILDDQTKIVGCFVKNSGLRKHYRLLYKTSNHQFYEGEVIYDIVRRRAYILNFGKQFSV